MEPNKSEESDEMYSPDDQGEYMSKVGTPGFSVHKLSDALTALDTMTEVQPPSEEFALQLEVMMAQGIHTLLHFCAMWAWYYTFSEVILH